MYAKYTLPDGTRFRSFLWDDIQDNEVLRGYAEINRMRPNGSVNPIEIRKKLQKDDKGVYIVWRTGNGKTQKVYLNEFDYMPYDTLVDEVQRAIDVQNRYLVEDDDILATFMRCSDEVIIQADMPKQDLMLPFGLSSSGDEISVPCHLSESQYPKKMWSYKITLEPNVAGVAYSSSYYFSDFCSMLKKGDCGFKLLRKEN